MAKLIDIGFPAAGASIALGGTITDDSGNGNNLTVAGGAMSLMAGQGGQAGILDRTTYATVASASAVKPTTAVTWMAWMYRTGTLSMWGQIFGRCNDDTGWGDAFSFYASADSPDLVMAVLTTLTSGGSPTTLSDPAFHYTSPLNTWFHLACTWGVADGGTLRMYVNGSPTLTNVRNDVAVYYGSGGNTTRLFNIGRNEQYNEMAGNMALDEIRVFDTILTGTQITTEMNTRSGAAAAPAAQDLILPERTFAAAGRW